MKGDRVAENELGEQPKVGWRGPERDVPCDI